MTNGRSLDPAASVRSRCSRANTSSANAYIALDVDEEPAVDVVNKIGAEYFVVSSDYPHSDGAFPEAIQQFLGLPLNDEQRRKILWDNCARLYDIATPAAPLTRDQNAVSAAE